MKDNLLFALAVIVAVMMGYSLFNYGLIPTAGFIAVISTLWLACLAAFTPVPQVPLPFWSAYPRRVYVAAYIALLFGIGTLLGTGHGVFFFIDMLAVFTLAVQWWRPVHSQKGSEK